MSPTAFSFPELDDLPAASDAEPGRKAAAGPFRSIGRGTRIKPPGDVIKLEDRLEYLLQPPLEALLAERSLESLPAVSLSIGRRRLLYPRHAAILADEMGLGKTMQAITAIRLLLRRGELQNVLLICPKPWPRTGGGSSPSGPPKSRC